MSSKVNKATGEVLPVIHTWRNPRAIKALKCDERFIQHKGFEYDPEIRALKVVDTELEDREAYIQSFADDCGVYNVLKKYSKTGDISLLSQREAIYGDISELPTDNLDPAGAKVASEAAIANLNEKLGVQLTAEELASMSADELNALIGNAIQAAASKAVPEAQQKEGE